MFNIGPTELIVILIIALLVFGPKRLPEVGRSIGRSLREFRRASDEIRGELEKDLDDQPTQTIPTTPSTSTADPAPTAEIRPTTTSTRSPDSSVTGSSG